MADILELRQYTLHPGRRDELIDLFEREFVESQEAVGMRIFGQFTDAADADRFVWIRGFADMETRRAALGAFYGGPVWAAHRDAANATMIDSDNVLLLRVVGDGLVVPDPAARPELGSQRPSSVIVALLARPGEHAPAGGDVLVDCVTHAVENTFPALPVRNEEFAVSLRRFPDEASATSFVTDLDGIEHLLLRPTSRSQLR